MLRATSACASPMPNVVAEGSVQVRTDHVQSRTESLEEVRSAAEALVDREWIRTRSRTMAYEIVGTMIGVSGMWVRRFVNGYPGGTLSYVIGMNILALYQRVQRKPE